MAESLGGKSVEGDEKWWVNSSFRSLWRTRDGGQAGAVEERKRSFGEKGDLEFVHSLGQTEENTREKRFEGQRQTCFTEICIGGNVRQRQRDEVSVPDHRTERQGTRREKEQPGLTTGKDEDQG